VTETVSPAVETPDAMVTAEAPVVDSPAEPAQDPSAVVETPAPVVSEVRWTTGPAEKNKSASLGWLALPILGAGAFALWRFRKK
jgi:hypothetical protein